MSRFKATVAYDGANYCGWQVQPNGISVEKVIEDALEIINKVPVNAVSSGRTDAGVHAEGQVFHFDSELKMTGEQWTLALNSNLPNDIFIKKVEVVDDNFHSRYDAQWKQYNYTINMSEYNPFEYKHELEYNKPLDVRQMRQAAQYFVGTHDFAAFNANSLQERPNQTRTIYELVIKENRGKLTIVYVGNGFLRYMVRMMTQTLIEVGKRKIKPKKVKDLLGRAVKNSVSYNAPSQGLCLIEVGYDKYEPKF